MSFSALCAVLANEFFPKFTSKIITVTPLIGVILTTLLCASPVSSYIQIYIYFLLNFETGIGIDYYLISSEKIGQVADVLKTQGAQLILPVALLHAAAFAIGYWISKFSFGESTSRTISIECGMQVSYFLLYRRYTLPFALLRLLFENLCTLQTAEFSARVLACTKAFHKPSSCCSFCSQCCLYGGKFS